MKKLSMVALALLTPLFLMACASQEANVEDIDTSQYGPPIAMQNPIEFDSRAGVRMEVRKECKLQTKVPEFAKRFAAEHQVNIQLVDDLDNTNIPRKVDVQIVKVDAPGGGGWSGGDMWMRVKATLYENGEKQAVAHIKRETSGGMYEEFKSTCAIIGRCTEAIGDDLARWLKNPEDGVYIGNFPKRYPTPSYHGTPGGPPTPGMPGPPGPP